MSWWHPSPFDDNDTVNTETGTVEKKEPGSSGSNNTVIIVGVIVASIAAIFGYNYYQKNIAKKK